MFALFLLFLYTIPSLGNPDFALDSLDIAVPKLEIVNSKGEIKSLDSFPKPLLVHLWASWCECCKIEIPELASIANKKATILIVSVDDKPANASVFLEKVAPKLEFWRVVDVEASKKFWAWGLPTTYLFGEKSARALGTRQWRDLSEAQFLSLFSKTNK